MDLGGSGWLSLQEVQFIVSFKVCLASGRVKGFLVTFRLLRLPTLECLFPLYETGAFPKPRALRQMVQATSTVTPGGHGPLISIAARQAANSQRMGRLMGSLTWLCLGCLLCLPHVLLFGYTGDFFFMRQHATIQVLYSVRGPASNKPLIPHYSVHHVCILTS